MADWLKPMFGRSKVQVAPNASDRSASLSFEESVPVTDSEDGNSVYANTPRLRPTSRVSSYIGIRPSTPPIPQTPDTFFNFRNPETVYHDPSCDQMAEMLKVVMMNQSTMSQVPVQYNSTILHVLEAYQELRMDLRRKEETIEELKQTHTNDIKDFEMLATKWELKEQDYKGEMKKLEILLSRTAGGLEQVSLARTKSRVHGSKIGESIGKDVGTIKARNVARNSRGRSDNSTETPTNPQEDDKYRADRFFKTRIKTSSRDASNAFDDHPFGLSSRSRVLQPQASIDSIPIYASPAELNDPTQQQTANPDLTILTQLQLKDLERQRAHEEFGVAFDSSTESDSSTGSPPQSNNEAISPIVTPSGLGLGIQANPLPAIPNPKVKKSDLSIRSNFLCDESISSKSRYDRLSRDSPTQVAFSFRPGDEDVLAQKSGVGDRPRRMPERRSYQRSSMETSEQHSQSSSVTRDNASDTSRRSQAALTKHSAGPNMPSRTSSSRSRPLETQEFDFMKRDDSRGSVVTALRDNSGRSSVASSQNNSLSRRGLQRNTSSNEAVTAAARALTADAKKRSEQKGSGSGSGERGSREKSSYGDVTAEDRR